MTPDDKRLIDELLRRAYADLYLQIAMTMDAAAEAAGLNLEEFQDLMASSLARRSLEIETAAHDRFRRYVVAAPRPTDPDT